MKKADIEIRVEGIPAPQGSKSIGRGGQMYESSKKLKPWRDAVVWATKQVMAGRPPLRGALRCEIYYTLPKPKSAVKAGRNWPSVKPDGDKLDRATHDALTQGGAWVDDAQVVQWSGGKQYYSEHPGATPTPGAWIFIWRLDENS